MPKILVIEDDLILIELYSKKFRNQGFEIITAYDGEQGIERMKAYKPDLVLLDIMMPNMTGVRVLELAKANNELKNIPIVMLTNIDSKEAIESFKKKGAFDFLVKSDFSPDQIVEKTKEIIKKLHHS